MKKTINDNQETEQNGVGFRPWGKYEILTQGNNYKVKKISVEPGASLSLQSHEKRAEHWVVVEGMARIINGEKSLVLHENESTYIPAQTIHQLANDGKTSLVIIEVQTGDYLEEDDIIRYKDQYGRKTGKASS